MTTTVTTANAIVGYKVGNSYKIGNKIGSGSFGEIHRGSFFLKKGRRYIRMNTCVLIKRAKLLIGTDEKSGEEVAIKLEKVTAKHPQLEYEYRVYKAIAGGIGIPRVRHYSTEYNYNTMIMDRLGRKYISIYVSHVIVIIIMYHVCM